MYTVIEKLKFIGTRNVINFTTNSILVLLCILFYSILYFVILNLQFPGAVVEDTIVNSVKEAALVKAIFQNRVR